MFSICWVICCWNCWCYDGGFPMTAFCEIWVKFSGAMFCTAVSGDGGDLDFLDFLSSDVILFCGIWTTICLDLRWGDGVKFDTWDSFSFIDSISFWPSYCRQNLLTYAIIAPSSSYKFDTNALLEKEFAELFLLSGNSTFREDIRLLLFLWSSDVGFVKNELLFFLFWYFLIYLESLEFFWA